MKQGPLQESHPFDLITRHLFEIARQLKHQKMRKVLQAHVTYLAYESEVLLSSIIKLNKTNIQI